jgi:hypothetical protein
MITWNYASSPRKLFQQLVGDLWTSAHEILVTGFGDGYSYWLIQD